MKSYYSADGSRRREIDTFDFDTSDDGDMLEICEQAAKDHYKNHDGFESRWPITIRIYRDIFSDAVFSGEVELDHEPVFTAGRSTEAEGCK